MPVIAVLKRFMTLRRWFEFGAIGVAACMILYMLSKVTGAHGYLLQNGQPMFGDYIAFWCAGKIALAGDVAHVHEKAAEQLCQLGLIQGMHVMAPYNSPPTWLLFCVPLALLPYPISAMTFLLLTGGLYLYAARKLLPDWRALLFAVTLPAALYHPGNVQVGMLIAGISALAIYWLDKRPRVSGALVALLAIKPHLAVVWPIFLAVSRRWNAFIAAAVCVTLFVLLAGLVFGFDSYLRFFENLERSQNLITNRLVGKQTYGSLYGSLLGLNVPQKIAMISHGVSAVLGLLTASYVFWKGDRVAGGIALCAATLLVSPYLFYYDSTLLAVAGALLFKPRNIYEGFAIICAWGAGLSVALGFIITLPVCASAAWIVLLAAFMRARSAAKLPAPEPLT